MERYAVVRRIVQYGDSVLSGAEWADSFTDRLGGPGVHLCFYQKWRKSLYFEGYPHKLTDNSRKVSSSTCLLVIHFLPAAQIPHQSTSIPSPSVHNMAKLQCIFTKLVRASAIVQLLQVQSTSKQYSRPSGTRLSTSSTTGRPSFGFNSAHKHIQSELSWFHLQSWCDFTSWFRPCLQNPAYNYKSLMNFRNIYNIYF